MHAPLCKILLFLELEVAVERINTTVMKGKILKAAVFTMASDSSEDASTLILQDIPDNVDEEYLETFLSRAMKIDESEFSVKCLGNGAALLSFKKYLTDMGKFKRENIPMSMINWVTIQYHNTELHSQTIL